MAKWWPVEGQYNRWSDQVVKGDGFVNVDKLACLVIKTVSPGEEAKTLIPTVYQVFGQGSFDRCLEGILFFQTTDKTEAEDYMKKMMEV